MSVDIRVLKNYTPFNDLSEEYLGRVQKKLQRRQYEAGAMIGRIGSEQTDAVYLLKGAVDLVDEKRRITEVRDTSDRRFYPLSEQSLLAVNIIAKGPVELMHINRDFLDLVIAWSESSEFTLTELKDQQVEVDEDDEHDWMSALLQSPLFSQLPPANIQQLFTRFEPVDVAINEEVVREGEEGDYFYAIKSGKAKVLARRGKQEVPLGPGQYFGEEALVGDTLRNATVVMERSGVLMRLGKEDFKSLLQEPILRSLTMDELRALAEQSGAKPRVLDVRMPFEYKHQHVPSSRNIPLAVLRNKLDELEDGDTLYVITDDAGRRSEVATHILCQHGRNAYVLKDAHEHYGQT